MYIGSAGPGPGGRTDGRTEGGRRADGRGAGWAAERKGGRADGRAEILEHMSKSKKDAQRISVQKDVLNSSPSFF